jgi:curved DNA-binding protein CbpA
MVLLVKWLHPDKDPQGQRSVFASRVTSAWDDLKTPDRRAGYDKGRRIAAQKHMTKSGLSSISKRMLVSPRRTQRFFVMHISGSQSLLNRAWLFLLHVARQ